MRPNRFRLTALLAALAMPAGVVAAAPAPDARVTLRPECAGGVVTAVAVRIDLPAPAGGALTLGAPVVYPGAPGVADRVTGLAVRDAAGPVPLRLTEDAPVKGGFPYFRHWTAARAIKGRVVVTYRSAVMAPGGPNGPAFGLRAVGGGLAGAGAAFLVLPEDGAAGAGAAKTPWRLHWDLSAFPAGASAAMSYGAGDVTLPGGAEALGGSWFMAGPLARYPAQGTQDGFAASWLGQPVFPMAPAMARAAAVHRYLHDYFPHLKGARDYRIFVQFRDQAPYGGGTALDRSFMLSRGPLAPGEQAETPDALFFHEMIHQWTGQIEAPVGVSSWFSEGLTTYYEDLLPYRGRFVSGDSHLDTINRLARRYFTSKARNMSAADVVKVGFADEEVRHIVYYRAALYFHDLDARIRARSGGRRDLESVLFPLFLSREAGVRFDTAAWLAAITAELGPDEAGRFERLIIAGSDTLDPAADSFGRCFTRVPASWDGPQGPVRGWQWQRSGAAGADCAR